MQSPRVKKVKRAYFGLVGRFDPTEIQAPEVVTQKAKKESAFTGLTGRQVGRPKTNFKTPAEKKRDQRRRKRAAAAESARVTKITELVTQQRIDDARASLPWYILNPYGGKSLLETGDITPSKIEEWEESNARLAKGKKSKGSGPSTDPDKDSLAKEKFEKEWTFAKSIRYSKSWILNGPDKEIDFEDFIREAPKQFLVESPASWKCEVPGCEAEPFFLRAAAERHLLEEHRTFLSREFKSFFRLRKRAYREAQRRHTGAASEKLTADEVIKGSLCVLCHVQFRDHTEALAHFGANHL